MTVVFGRSVVDWAETHLEPFKGEALGLGLKKDDQFVAAVVYHDRQYHNVHGSIVALPGSLTRPFIRAMFHYPFNQLRVARITSCVRPSNAASVAWNRRMGFLLEGRQRRGYPDGEDKLIFGMLREECRWLNS